MIELDTHWHSQARCAGMNDDTFFPEKSELGKIKKAEEICGSAKNPRCPVREQCLSFALQTNQRFGVWGGMSAHARRPKGVRWDRNVPDRRRVAS